MRKFWIVITLLSFVACFAVGLTLVVERCEGSIEPFIMLCIGGLCIPGLIKDLFSKNVECNDDINHGPKFLKFMLIGVVVAIMVCAGLWFLNLKYGGLETGAIIAIGVSVLIAFAIIYFFMWFMDDKI